MKVVSVNDFSSQSFGKFKLSGKEYVAANNAISNYLNSPTEKSKMAVINACRKQIEKAANTKFSRNHYKADYKQDLFESILVKLEEIDKNVKLPVFSLLGAMNSVKPNKSIFEGEFERLENLSESDRLILEDATK